MPRWKVSTLTSSEEHADQVRLQSEEHGDQGWFGRRNTIAQLASLAREAGEDPCAKVKDLTTDLITDCKREGHRAYCDDEAPSQDGIQQQTVEQTSRPNASRSCAERKREVIIQKQVKIPQTQ